ncbi:unnamed protein product [Rotaria socialis]|uniref:Bardet-Biedl syndrome 2 protein homolog n=3 Tax=Rotaria socialis TaxID=392032 RepID=A0A817PW05_9BILA|nr:unnamed protein product [Rotaria socialis]CAF3212116.1 unnamed protein product [Rotaria socialis]CAF3333899.1 unnamed protein product [Rotaria socialis]CAF3446893.1 unnamed protein product [Rotaria socialis]CAF3809109.1 unnamed protein product [Rotaria socialis]
MLVPVFSLQLNTKVFPRTVSVGKFNGKQSCLVGATAGNKVFIHSPRDVNLQAQQLDGNISLLNVNQVVTSLGCGQLDEQLKKDLLVVGTSTNIVAYDIDRNVDLFFKDNPDGAHAITIGQWGELPEKLAIVGGNCSIHGYNKKSEDVLWTVTGDNVSSLALLDFNGDGYNELVVGSEDYDIRVFREDQLIAEMQETETIVSMCPLDGARFGYALANGTVGIYERSNRHWRIKSRHIAVVLQAFDVNGDGVDELVTGWSSGKVDIRSDRQGEVIFKESLNSSIAGIVKADYRVAGENLLICCSNEGQVRGFKFSEQDPNALTASLYRDRQEAIRDLAQKKQALLIELEHLGDAIKHSKYTINKPTRPIVSDSEAEIPAHTKIETLFTVEKRQNDSPAHVAVRMKTSNNTIIRVVTIFAEGLFKGECLVTHPAVNHVKESIAVPIIPARDTPVDLHIQVFVGFKSSTLFHVFELTRPLPMFSMYMMIENAPDQEPKGFVTFYLNERIPRALAWINHNFLLAQEYAPTAPSLYVTFLAIRNDTRLIIKMQNNGQITIQTDDMELAGNVIQSMCKFLNIDDLQTTGDFPHELEILQKLFSEIEEYQIARQRISSDMAEHSNIIRSFLIRAEDARLLGDISCMKRNYIDLLNLNRDLIHGYKIRCTNHEELMKKLRYLNQMVQKAGNLRFGKYKTIAINQCRAAIKANNAQLLIKTIKTGSV